MKKIVFAMLMAGSSCVAWAQVDNLKQADSLKMQSTTIAGDTTDFMDNGVMTTTADYNAYSTYTALPPDYMSGYVLRDYPAAMDVRWRQEGEWWHGFYLSNGIPNHVYYNDAGQTFIVALPVRQSLVPDQVVNRAVELYGPALYDISTVPGTNDQEIYSVRLLEDGQMSTVWIDEDGNRVLDVYRMENSMDNAAMDDNMNRDNMNNLNANDQTLDMDVDKDTKVKIKVEKSDGTETKTKIKNGKVKTKTDD